MVSSNQPPPERRLRQFLHLLGEPIEAPNTDLFGPALLRELERVIQRTRELGPKLGGATITDAVATAVRIDATLVSTTGSTWRATCIVEPGAPHRIEALRFDERPSPTAPGDGRLVVIAGESSAGKSSTARELQDQLAGPWLHLDRDALIRTLPSAYHPFPELWGAVPEGIHAAVRALVETGNSVLFDTVLTGEDEMRSLRQTFEGLPALYVYLTCDAELLQERRALRPDRPAGLISSRAANDVTSADLVIDTTVLPPRDVAKLIVQRVPIR